MVSFTGVISLPQVYLPVRPGTSVEELIVTTHLCVGACGRKGGIAGRFWVESLIRICDPFSNKTA